MSENKETIEERYEYHRFGLEGEGYHDAVSLLDDLMTEREKMKELKEDRYEFPVNEWNEQLVQTINDQGCPAKIVLTRRKQAKITED